MPQCLVRNDQTKPRDANTGSFYSILARCQR